MTEPLDAVVVGSGPNGLVAAINLARQGWSVRVVERADQVGGGMRSAELTLPGFVHDVCSAAHPLGLASPAMRTLGLEAHGVEWIQPDAPLVHALRPERGVVLERSIAETELGLGIDGATWRSLFGGPTRSGYDLIDSLLAPLTIPPRHPLALAGYAPNGIRSAAALAKRFPGDEGPALLAGMAAHSMLPLTKAITGGMGIMFGVLGHLVGWPVVRGGSQSLADGLVSLLESLGGEVQLGTEVRSLADLPPARAVLFDTSPLQLVEIVGDLLPSRYRRQLLRFRSGPGIFKVDWALDGPVPWTDPALGRSATVHLGGSFDEVAASEYEMTQGRHPDEPFTLLAQQSLFDPTRAPGDAQVLWGYCHVPNGSTLDMTDRIESRIERFAPGFRDRILARHTANSADVQSHNPNYLGGDINGGLADLWQFAARPVPSLHPWRTPATGVYLCSASTPPGGGVHGMCGMSAADRVLADARAGRLTGIVQA